MAGRRGSGTYEQNVPVRTVRARWFPSAGLCSFDPCDGGLDRLGDVHPGSLCVGGSPSGPSLPGRPRPRARGRGSPTLPRARAARSRSPRRSASSWSSRSSSSRPRYTKHRGDTTSSSTGRCRTSSLASSRPRSAWEGGTNRLPPTAEREPSSREAMSSTMRTDRRADPAAGEPPRPTVPGPERSARTSPPSTPAPPGTAAAPECRSEIHPQYGPRLPDQQHRTHSRHSGGPGAREAAHAGWRTAAVPGKHRLAHQPSPGRTKTARGPVHSGSRRRSRADAIVVAIMSWTGGIRFGGSARPSMVLREPCDKMLHNGPCRKLGPGIKGLANRTSSK